MKCLALICLQLALLHDHVVCGIPREMYNAKYDGFVDDQIVPEQESLVNRNTDNLGSVERISNDEDDENDDNDFSSYVSNLNNGGNSYSYSSSSSNGQTIVNGIDSSKLPPNYHNVTKTTKMINGRPVTVYVTVDKKTDPVTGQVSVSVKESSSSNSVSSSTSTSFGRPNTCVSSQQCKAGYFCRSSWVRTCQRCRNVNQFCRQNEECCGNGATGALCVNGICQVGYRKGDAGTLCQSWDDCDASMCCARSFMKHFGVCKPLAKNGERCAASSSSMSLMVSPGTCPCERGLLCSSGGWTHSFFGGSMDTVTGGNTCRVPRRRAARPRRRWWGGW